MTNYVRTADFAGKDALISGNPAKAVKGVDLGIEFDAIAAMSATKLDASNSANPTVSVGLATVNGTAATFMRSDGAPALSQAIVPTWTGTHTFSAGLTSNAGATINTAARNVASLGQLAQTYGNTTDNPTYAFTGSGQFSIGSRLTVATSGNTTVTGTSPVISALDGGAAGARLDIGATNTKTTINFSANVTATPGAIQMTGADVINISTARNVTIGAPASGASLAVADDGGTLQTVGWRDLPQNSQAGNYTTVMADRGKHILNSTAGSLTFTIAANASVAYPNGTTLTFCNGNGGTACTIAINADTLVWSATNGTGSRTLAAGGMATAIKITSTQWLISGSGLT